MSDNSSKTLLLRKATVLGSVSKFSLPPFPEVPPSMVKRFPELAEFNESVKRWLDNANHALEKLSSAKSQE